MTYGVCEFPKRLISAFLSAMALHFSRENTSLEIALEVLRGQQMLAVRLCSNFFACYVVHLMIHHARKASENINWLMYVAHGHIAKNTPHILHLLCKFCCSPHTYTSKLVANRQQCGHIWRQYDYYHRSDDQR